MSAANARIAYIMSRFPKVTETFILYEILALEARGVPVDVHPLLREKTEVVHPEAARLLRRIRFHPFVSLPILASNLRFLTRRPFAYLRALFDVLAGTFGSLNFFVGALGVFPKSVRFAEEMQRAGVTHVHAHFATHPTVAALIIHRLTGIPFSFTVHGHDLHVEKRMLDRKVREAAFVISISEYNRRTMVDCCGEWARDKIRIVHCGVDPEVFAYRRRPPHDGPLRLLNIGRFDEVKGHEYLVDACASLEERGVDFRCDIVGGGPRRERIRERIERAGLADRVRILGARPRPEVARLVAEADVFVLPSVMAANGEREGIPVALMEAMIAGLPVVSSVLSGIPELVTSGESGLLVPPRDAAALADALERLARDPELRARLGAAGRAKVEAEFDLAANVDRLTRLLLEERPPAPAVGVPRTARA
ncbi:MAG TPA: glycosyltransferase [bacterium]|nr:glycosyltransferase [bacterium]